MRKRRYDIFLSYNHRGGHQYARILYLLLTQRGYNVFYDYNCLSGNPMSMNEELISACKEAPIFMPILSHDVFSSEYVRKGTLFALKEKKHIVPIVPDGEFDFFLPEEIEEIGNYQHCKILFDSALGACIDQMIKDRIVPYIGERKHSNHVDMDFETAQETLRKMYAHNRFLRRLVFVGIVVFALIVLVVFATCLWDWIS